MSDEHFSLSPTAPPPPTEADYEAIAAAVMETLRGRWFLAEFAKRNRNADTELILAAIDRVEALVRDQRPLSPAERVRIDLVEMAKAIAQTRSEIAAIKPDGDAKGTLSEATEELDSIVQTTERATSDILAAAEQVQEIAWTLRERGADGETCDALDRRATDIYSACSFQDLTGQRTRKVVDVLQFLEERIRAMIEIWGGAVPASEAPVGSAAPPHLGEDRTAAHLEQPEIDQIMPAPLPGKASRNARDVAGDSRGPDGTHAAAADENQAIGPNIAASAVPSHADSLAAAETAAVAEPVMEPAMAPAISVMGATALALDLAPIDVARQPEPAAEPVAQPEPPAGPEADARSEPPPEPVSEAQTQPTTTPDEPRADPAAVLKRILAIIRGPGEASAQAGAVEHASAALSAGGGQPNEAAAPQPMAPEVAGADAVSVDIVPPVVAAEAAADVCVMDVVAVQVAEPDGAPAEIAAVRAERPAADSAPHAGIEDDVADDILMPLLGPVTVDQAVDEMLMRVPVRLEVTRASVAAIASPESVEAKVAEQPAAVPEPEAARGDEAEQPFVIEVPAASVTAPPDPAPDSAAAPTAEPAEPAPAPVSSLASSEPMSATAEPPADPVAIEPAPAHEPPPEPVAAAPALVVAADPAPATAPEPEDEPSPEPVAAALAPVVVADPVPAPAPEPAPPPRPAAAPVAPPAVTAARAPRPEGIAAITALSDEKIALFS